VRRRGGIKSVYCLTDPFALHGPPEHLRSDNGPEFAAATYANGSAGSVSRHFTLNREAHGRKAIARA
jgi:hypothetical protein